MSGPTILSSDYPVGVIRKLENEVKQLKDEKQTLHASLDKLKHELNNTTVQLTTAHEQLKQAGSTYADLEVTLIFFLKKDSIKRKLQNSN